MNRLKKCYLEEIRPQLLKELGLTNVMMVPSVTKVVINMGTGDAAKDKGVKEKIVRYFTALSGQKAQFRVARKSIAEFSVREGDAVGIMVTLRGERCFDFLDKLVSIVLPRVRDFQGLKLSSFDDQGNYSIGLKEQTIFPEVVYDTIDRVRSLEVTIKTKSRSKSDSIALLKALGMPFEKEVK